MEKSKGTSSVLPVTFDFSINRPRRLTPDEKEFLGRWTDEEPPA